MKRFLQIVVCLIAMTSMARAAAPVISNVLVTATTPTSGTITWTTDIPSTSMLQYGTTSAIPYQTNVNYTLTTTHSMTLPLLTAGPLYYVAAVSGDNAGNNTQSATITFSVCGSPTIPVSGTVNNYYEYGSYTLTWIPPTGTSGTTPTACGAPIQKTITGNLSGSASFTTAVADASKVVPGPGQWEIQATDAGNLAPITTYAYLAQSSQDVSPALQLAASTAGLTACIINTLSGITYPTDCGGGALSLQHNGVPLTNQKVLNFNDAIPAPPGGNINVTFQSDANGDLSGYIPTGGIGGCPQGVCIQNSPTATQGVSQPASTTFYLNAYDPQSAAPASIQGFPLTMNSDFSQYQVNSGSGSEGFPGGLQITSNYYGLTQNTQNTFGGVPSYGYGSYLAGTRDIINRYNSGQTFGSWNNINCHGTGDCIGQFDTVTADGGINRQDDEGVKWADSLVQEDPLVFTATINAAVSTGATVIPTNCTIGCNTEGADRLLIDTNSGKTLTGTFTQSSWAATVNQVPFAISDASASYPVSTIFALCYSGSDNGAGGAAGCPTNGTAPSGYIPPQSTSPTQQSPAASIATTVLPSYSGQPGYFCTSIQSSNPSGSCYVPASGVVCISDAQEYETVNYTYSGGTMTLLNLQFSHLNGMTAAVGGMCGDAVEASNTIYTLGGTTGVQSQVYPIEGSPNSTTILDITQRTNEGYGSVAIGDSQNDWGFSTTASGFSSSGALININVTNPSSSPGVPTGAYSGCLAALNDLSVTINTANSTYNGTYPLTQTGCNSFTYSPGTVSGTQPTTGTVSFTNMQYTIFPAARVISVSDSYIGTQCTSLAACIRHNFYLMPNTMAWALSDPVREPHYQQMNITGGGSPRIIERWTREQYIGSDPAGTTNLGVMSRTQEGTAQVNEFPSTEYVGHGGTYQAPQSAYRASGIWNDDLDISSAPENSILNVVGWKPDIGPSSPLSFFSWLTLPSLPGSFPGFNSDICGYDPSYNLANRGQAITSGLFYCGQNAPGTVINHQSVTAFELGQFIADWSLTAPQINANNVSVNTLSNTPAYSVLPIGTPGSTVYNYEIVSHDENGGSTVPTGPGFFNTGNATLNSTNYNQICAFRNPGVYSYDFLKEVSGTWYSLATNVAVGNGASFSQVPNYTCFNDQGGSTSAYVVPTVNTTGSIAANSVVTSLLTATTSISTPNVFATNLTVGNCVQAGAGGLLVTTANPCGSGGGGMVYPPTGVGNSNGTAWSTSYQVGTAANDLVQLTGSGAMPAVSAAAMTGYLYTNLAGSGIVPLANGGTGTASPGLVGGTGITISGSWPNQTITASGSGGSGFPIILGSTSIAGSSTTASISGLTVNGVTLVSGGSTSSFLNQYGTYSTVAQVTNFSAPSGSWPTWLVPTVTNSTTTPSLAVAASTIPIAAGGTGTTTPALVAGLGIAISGSWPDQTVALAVTPVAINIASFAIPANTCYGSSGSSTPATVTMTGVTTSPVTAVVPSYSANSSAIAGWGTTGGLNLEAWASASNTVSYLVCNPTASSITGGAITFILAAL